MKVQTKKEVNLLQLIEHAWVNNIRNTSFKIIDRGIHVSVSFDSNGNFHAGHGLKLSKSDRFTIVLEEELTEDTIIPKALNVFNNKTDIINEGEDSQILYNVTIKEISDKSKNNLEDDRLYIMNDDFTVTLIWTKREGIIK